MAPHKKNQREAVENAAPAQNAETKGVAVTYVPGRDDPVSVVWNRKVFEANKPVVISDSVMITKAKRNPWFKVDGAPQAQKGFDPVNDTPRNPTEYRAYAVSWFKVVKSSAELAQRWKKEADLREVCECGTDDEEYLARFYDPRFAALKKMEDAGEVPRDVIGQ